MVDTISARYNASEHQHRTLTIDLILLFIAVLVLLPLWGATSDDLSSWINKALFGFRIGNVTISLTAIVIAVAIFGAILMVTRVLQHVLGERLLPMTGVDSGVRDSLRTALGYVGFIIAAAIGLSFAGVDLSQLAIIAGALSIGMGFGLQNVVNNFVSGLILLVERPIKVGDWIIAGAHQGYVKKINVRATKIETFDRSSVIVPNSELISAPVTNWFFKDRNGRVIVNVGVSYDADPEKVCDILIDIASTNPGILKKPSPSCHFVNFGDSSLDFSLRFFIRNIDYMMSIGSEVRYAIAKRFRGEGIEIPFPQREVNLRDIKQRLSLRIVCMDVRWRLRGKPGVRRSPVQAVGTIAGSCRDIWSRRLGSAARNPSTGCVGC